LTWVALELTPQGEKLVEDGVFADEIRNLLGVDSDWPVFVPTKVYEKRGKRITVHLMEGYVFVATGLDEVVFFRLEGTKYVERVMTQESARGMRVLSVIPDSQICEMRKQLLEEVASDIVPGMKVLIAEGVYAKLEGVVEDIEGEYAIVYIELRSLKTITKIPKVFLEAL